MWENLIMTAIVVFFVVIVKMLPKIQLGLNQIDHIEKKMIAKAATSSHTQSESLTQYDHAPENEPGKGFQTSPRFGSYHLTDRVPLVMRSKAELHENSHREGIQLLA